MVRKVAAALLFGSFALSTPAAEIYKWSDENGQTQYGHSVPGAYRGNARPIDVKLLQPTDAQRREAEARLARDKDRAASMMKQRIASQEQPKPQIAAPQVASQIPRAGATVRPARSGEGRAQCEAEWKRFTESQDCFAPYRTRYGIKAEAFKYCVEVPQPAYCE